MPGASFSKAILDGMNRWGCSQRQILKITGLSGARYKAILSERARLTDKEIAAIENATGRSSGQLAALTLPKSVQHMTSIFDDLAICLPTDKRRTIKRAS